MSESDTLKSLHTAIVDARAGYKVAQSDADDRRLRALFEEADAAHSAAHRDIHKRLLALGEQPDDSGSFMSTVHETVVAIRSAVTGLNQGALGSFASGEERNIDLYDEAIQSFASDPTFAATLQKHRDNLAAVVTKMKAGFPE